MQVIFKIYYKYSFRETEERFNKVSRKSGNGRTTTHSSPTYCGTYKTEIPFKLDTLKNVPRTVREGAYFTSIDDKSGFDNVLLSEESQTLVGFQWGGFYFVFKTLPFGFNLSSYIYHI
jgi:hypothetical protein